MSSQPGKEQTVKLIVKLSALAVLAVWAACAVAADPPPAKPAAPDEVVVLDDNTLWRHYLTTRCAFVRNKNGELEAQDLTPLTAGGHYDGILNPRPAASTNPSPLPPADWAGLTFDDSAWPRVRLPQPSQTDGAARPQRREGGVATVLLRGKFDVKDPAQVKTCTLSLDYWGGVVVYLNGKEVLRRHVPGDKPDFLALAEDYPDEAFVTPKGHLKDWYEEQPGDKKAEGGARPALHERSAKAVALPVALLKPGLNVLAVEVHTAPFYDFRKHRDLHRFISWLPWGPIQLRHAQLTVSPAGAAVANVARPSGVRVWNVGVGETVTAFDYGTPGEKLAPIVIHAARNSVFSGRLAVDSDQPIKGLKATVTDLAQVPTGGKIPASAVRVRYAVAATGGKSFMSPHRFDGLLDAIPAEIPVVKDPPKQIGQWGPIFRTNLAAGAVAPLWFTVRVPKDARPGVYEGRVTLSAEGLPPTDVPLRVNVSDWSMPDPKDFRIHNMAHGVFHDADEAVARHYDVPLWSERHFELLGKSRALMAEVGARNVQVNLTELITWVKQPDGSAKPDFTVFDQYLDMVAKSIGKPLPLRVNVWREGKKTPEGGMEQPPVSLRDPATNQIQRLPQPATGTKEAVAFWRPVFTEMLKKIKARGWLEVTALGWWSVFGGPPEDVANLAKQLWPEAVWACVAHDLTRNFRTPEPWVKIRYSHAVYGQQFPTVRGYRELLKPQAEILCTVFRDNWKDHALLSTLRRIGEDAIMTGYDGVGEFGTDYFPFKNGKDDREYRTAGSLDFPAGPRRSVHVMHYPGPDGPVATERYEAFREGMELAETLIYIERAIQDKKLSPALQERAEKALEARSHAFIMNWFTIRDMPAAEDAKLLALAGEVARELEQKK